MGGKHNSVNLQLYRGSHFSLVDQDVIQMQLNNEYGVTSWHMLTSCWQVNNFKHPVKPLQNHLLPTNTSEPSPHQPVESEQEDELDRHLAHDIVQEAWYVAIHVENSVVVNQVVHLAGSRLQAGQVNIYAIVF